MIDVDYNEYKKTIAENMELIVENYKLKQKYSIMKENAETLAKRINKAIEYLNQPYRDNFDYSRAELLDILQVVDKE
jgi:adenine-specific DNA methylase